jgi:hypothetical protein
MGMGKNAWVNKRMAELAASAGEREIEHVEYEEFQEIIWDIMEAGWRGRIPGEDDPITNMDIMHVFEKVDLDDSGTIDRNVSNWIECIQYCTYLTTYSIGDETGGQVPLSSLWD